MHCTSTGHRLSSVRSSTPIVVPLMVALVPIASALAVYPESPEGHAANSQLGPVRPTAEPSGHSFASKVQATGPVADPRDATYATTPSAARSRASMTSIVLIDMHPSYPTNIAAIF